MLQRWGAQIFLNIFEYSNPKYSNIKIFTQLTNIPIIHKWQCEGEGQARGEQGRAGDQVERRGRWGEEVAEHDDEEEDEDYNAFDATPRQKSDKLSVSRVTRLTNHARWGMKMVNHHPSFIEHFEAGWLEIFCTWCVWQNQYYWTVQHTLYIAARNVLTRVCLELNRPQLFNAMLSNEVDSFQCSLNKGTAFLLSNEVETHELTDEEF